MNCRCDQASSSANPTHTIQQTSLVNLYLWSSPRVWTAFSSLSENLAFTTPSNPIKDPIIFLNAAAVPRPTHSQKRATGGRQTCIRNQLCDTKTDFFGHPLRAHFVVEFKSVIMLGEFQSIAKKDSIGGEMKAIDVNKGQGSCKCSASMAVIIP